MEPAQPLVYECRPTALKRALTNLIDNAVKYGKTAHAAINATSKTIEITIDDEGPGIPKSELKRVLEPFYRVEESRSRETGGVGLGLAIALSAVQAHGGELLLSNRLPGGLRASIRLPGEKYRHDLVTRMARYEGFRKRSRTQFALTVAARRCSRLGGNRAGI